MAGLLAPNRRTLVVARVVLDAHEVLHGGLVGLTREIDNLKAGRKDRFGAEIQDGWRLHIEGALGELAVAKYLDRFWSGRLGNLKAADVGPLQVRTRVRRDDASLILHKTDQDHHLFVLAVSYTPVFTLIGWLRAADGKRPEYWRELVPGRAAYFVPQSALQPIESLSAALVLEAVA